MGLQYWWVGNADWNTACLSMQVYEDTTGTVISFSQWMSRGFRRRVDDSADRHSAGPESPDGSCCGSSRYWCLQRGERVLIIFGLTALAWMTRTEPFGGCHMVRYANGQ